MSWRIDKRTGWTLLIAGALILIYAMMTTYQTLPELYKAYLGAIGAVFVMIGLPPVLFQTNDLLDVRGHRSVTSWYFLLSEPGGGYSLSRFQFLIWFLPAYAIWVGVSVKTGTLYRIDDQSQLLTLLGLAGGTTVLGALISPQPSTKETPAPSTPPPGVPKPTPEELLVQIKQAAAGQDGQEPSATLDAINQRLADLANQIAGSKVAGSAMPREQGAPAGGHDSQFPVPNLRNLVEDWDGHGDVTRYQYLLLSTLIAVGMVAGFWRTGSVPTIPDNLWQFVAASSGSYLGTKMIKRVRPQA